MRPSCQAATALPLLVHPAPQPVALPGYDVDPGKITVSGISSGAYMAVQIATGYFVIGPCQ